MPYSRPLAFVLAASLAIPLTPAAAQQDDPNTITVNAPRHGPRAIDGEATETVTHSTKVSLSGIDLSTPGGLAALETKVRAAAKKSCSWLDLHYPVVDKESDCERSATDDAMARARARVAAR